MDDRCAELRTHVLEYALTLPEAYEDFPWGESVVKVRKKIFVFLGHDESEDCVRLGLKLPDSGLAILSEPYAQPSGYGLGKSGWVDMRFESPDGVPLDLLEDLVLESYRAVAPKRLAATVAPGT